jgi:dTDP-4-dehydrorhamnose 3,5-epimerase
MTLTASPPSSQAQPEPIAPSPALERAAIYLDAGLVHDAEELFGALVDSPDAAAAHAGLAQCAYRRRELHDALGHLQAAEQLDPGYPNLANDMGVVLFELGMNEQARAQFERAAQADPENPRPWRNLLDTAIASRDYDGCVRCARRVLALNPADAEARQIVTVAEEEGYGAAPITPPPPIIEPAPISEPPPQPRIEVIDRTLPGEIEGVRITSLPSEWDDRGYLIGVIRGDGPATPPSDVALVGHLRTGTIRAFHKHPERWEWCVVSHGSAKLVLEDDRADSPTFARVKTVVAGERNPTLVMIPPGVFHGWMALADDTQLICVGAGEQRQPESKLPDEIRIPPESFGDVWTILPRE